MFKLYCDNCGGECASSNNVQVRVFETLDAAKQGGRSLGLEIMPLFNGKREQNGHICDECMPVMLVAAANTFTKSRAALSYKTNEMHAENYKQLKTQLETKLEVLAEKEKLIDEQRKSENQRITNILGDLERKDRELHLLREQLRIAKVNAAEATRLEKAAKKQANIDQREYPEYAANTRKREAIRAGSE